MCTSANPWSTFCARWHPRCAMDRSARCSDLTRRLCKVWPPMCPFLSCSCGKRGGVPNGQAHINSVVGQPSPAIAWLALRRSEGIGGVCARAPPGGVAAAA
eukprot:5588653-Alexandrium_andersonii.AAC.1